MLRSVCENEKGDCVISITVPAWSIPDLDNLVLACLRLLDMIPTKPEMCLGVSGSRQVAARRMCASDHVSVVDF